MDVLPGESRFLPNLQIEIELTETQHGEVAFALKKLDGAHRSRIAWVGPCTLDGKSLSIHSLDLIAVLLQCRRTDENEIELFRLRKTAVDLIKSQRECTQDEIKNRNLEMWLDSYKKIWPGAEADIDLTSPPTPSSRIELIP
jgi:hypothetical protein